MKYNPIHKSAFRKDIIRCAKRNYDISALEAIMEKLENGEQLAPVLNHPHWLTGGNPRISDILIVVMCSVISGLEKLEEIVTYAENKRNFLSQAFKINSYPSVSQISRVLNWGKNI